MQGLPRAVFLLLVAMKHWGIMQNATYVLIMLNRWIAHVAPLVDLGLRAWLATVFFKAGLSKIASWPSTLFLFESEYAVPLLAPEPAAYIATAIELVLPMFLMAGLGTRLSALALFVFNTVAVVSYPGLTEVGRDLHLYWGFMLLALIAHGGGTFSVDAWLAYRSRKRLTNGTSGAI